jgi:hypothetical protein
MPSKPRISFERVIFIIIYLFIYLFRREYVRHRESLEPGVADDLVIVAKSERKIKEMMRSLGKYVRKKKLEGC